MLSEERMNQIDDLVEKWKQKHGDILLIYLGIDECPETSGLTHEGIEKNRKQVVAAGEELEVSSEELKEWARIVTREWREDQPLD